MVPQSHEKRNLIFWVEIEVGYNVPGTMLTFWQVMD